MVITKEKLISDIAKKEEIPLSTLQSIYKTLENYIFENLSSTTPTKNVEIKLFNGISIESTYHKSKEMIHPETGEIFETQDKIWAKPKITRYYNRKLNEKFTNNY